MKDLNILLNFLGNKSFEQVKQELSQKPYYLNFDETEDLYLLKYNQINSDMSNPITQLCRGIILEKGTNKPVCIPFYKFFNYGEKFADTINWNNCKVQEKIDGSIIKVFWYKNTWKLSTNGIIDAFKNKIKNTNYSLGSIFLFNIIRYLPDLNREYTYIFELVSPYNRVVINYPETKIYHIGTRNNITFEELDINIGVEKPKEFELKSLEECIKAASFMKEDKEGYVVVDNNYNRIKIKSPFYVQLHYALNNGQVTKERLILMLKDKLIDDFISIFPEYKEDANKIINNFNKICEDINNIYNRHFNIETKICNLSRKELASFIKDKVYSNIIFSLYDKKFDILNLNDYIISQSLNWLEKIL